MKGIYIYIYKYKLYIGLGDLQQRTSKRLPEDLQAGSGPDMTLIGGTGEVRVSKGSLKAVFKTGGWLALVSIKPLPLRFEFRFETLRVTSSYTNFNLYIYNIFNTLKLG